MQVPDGRDEGDECQNTKLENEDTIKQVEEVMKI
jgi:hypothetical protein